MRLSPAYLATLKKMHSNAEHWGTTGHKWAFHVMQMVREHEYNSVLDYGCGKGTLLAVMSPRIGEQVKLKGYDPAVPEFHEEPEVAELVTCTDVLEHIEPEHLDAVLEHIASLARYAAFFVISTRRALAVLPDGRNAHLIVADAAFWSEQLAKHFRTLKFDAGSGGELVVEAYP